MDCIWNCVSIYMELQNPKSLWWAPHVGKPGSYETLAKHIGARDMDTPAPISQLLVPISKLCITCPDPTKGLY